MVSLYMVVIVAKVVVLGGLIFDKVGFHRHDFNPSLNN
jgi:hypothetical protein